MYLCYAHVLPWSVCARSAQHWAPAESHTGAGHKGGNPYTPPHQNGLGEVQPIRSHNKGSKLPMSAIPTIVEYQYMKNPKGKKPVRYEQQKKKKSSQSGKLMGPLVCSQDSSKPQINHLQRSRYPHWHHSPPIKLGTASRPSVHADVLRGAPQHTPSYP